MAIYHCCVKRISRGAGRSAVGAAAYRRGQKLYNEYDGTTHDYTNRRGALGAAAYRSGQRLQEHDGASHDFTAKRGIVYSEIMLPEHAPREFQDSETLWNAVEKAEKQHNAQLAREVEIALPNELTTEQQIKLVQDYVRENFVNKGMCADFSIHSGHKHVDKTEINPDEPIKKNNPHTHIMLTVRPLNSDGTWGAKSKKEYILDKNGNRIKTKSGKDWRSRHIDLTDWEKPETLIKWRKSLAEITNKTFERLGIKERIDHRTLKAQGIEREPTIHIGVKAMQMGSRGLTTERGQRNREIQQRNNELAKIDRRIKEAERMKQQLREQREKRKYIEHSPFTLLREIRQTRLSRAKQKHHPSRAAQKHRLSKVVQKRRPSRAVQKRHTSRAA